MIRTVYRRLRTLHADAYALARSKMILVLELSDLVREVLPNLGRRSRLGLSKR